METTESRADLRNSSTSLIQPVFYKSWVGIALCCLALTISACDDSFQPISENDKFYFSIHGYLDASVDTQWVRITPLRDQIDTPAEVPAMTVTLKELDTGNSVVMQDSLLQNQNGFNYLNFWTTMDIRPEHTYRLVAKRPDGATSSVTVSTPGDFPTPKLTIVAIGPPILTIHDIERLADIQVVLHYLMSDAGLIRKLVYRFPFRNEAFGDSDTYSVYLRTRDKIDQANIPDGAELVKSYVFVASGGPEWIAEADSLDDATYLLPKNLSNVNNGIGYVAGILSKTIPF